MQILDYFSVKDRLLWPKILLFAALGMSVNENLIVSKQLIMTLNLSNEMEQHYRTVVWAKSNIFYLHFFVLTEADLCVRKKNKSYFKQKYLF